MKKILVILSVIAIIILACNTTKVKSILQKPNDVTPDEYTININRDTTLVTKNGALLKIPQGALLSDKSTVTLEIKEAYSLEQMIKIGLTTQAGDEPLSSGGMIYINAKGGQNVTIKQAIKVALPADYLNPDMKLFKGESTAEGGVNWTNPSSLPENKQLSAIEKGKQLFESKCANCHSIGKDMTGPNLAHILKRFDYFLGLEGGGRYFEHGYRRDPYEGYSGIYTIIKDSTGKEKRMYDDETIYYHPDPFQVYKCNLINRFGGLIVPRIFNTDTSSNGFAIYQYIQNESDRKALPLPAHDYLLNCVDSCENYKQTIFNLQEQKAIISEKREKLVDESPELTEEIKAKTGTISESPANFDNLVSPENNKGVYYQFSIETFGWYNIDILLSAQYGNQQSELFVRLKGEYHKKFDIFLIIPSKKIYVKGGATDDINKYAFGFKDGKIFLPQNAKAYIMAVSESSSSVAFALQEFTTSTKQELQLEMKSTSKEEFNIELTKLNNENLKITVKDTPNADSIRKAETDLKTIDAGLKKAESLKPKNCNCDCGYPQKTTPLNINNEISK